MSTTTTPPPAPAPRVPYTRLFRFATWGEVALTLIGVACGVANGVVFPCFSVIFGRILNAYATPGLDFSSAIDEFSLIFLLLAVGGFVASYFQTALPMLSAERQAMRLRARYLAALLRQPPAYLLAGAGVGDVELVHVVGLQLGAADV